MFVFNGKEFRFEVEDYNDLTRFNSALETLGATEAELLKTKDNDGFSPEFIRRYCQMVFRFFDTALEEGGACGTSASDAMFEGKMNMGSCEEAYVSFVEYVSLSAQEAAKARIKRRERLKQYLPGRRPYKAESGAVS